MSQYVEPGMVIYNHAVDRKFVAQRERTLSSNEEIIALIPHHDGDYSYRCGDEDCRCAGRANTKPTTTLAPTIPDPKTYPAPRRSGRDRAIRIMAERVRNATGRSLVDCRKALTVTKDVKSAINWLHARSSAAVDFRI